MLAAQATLIAGALAIACFSEVALASDPPLPAAADTSSSGVPQTGESEQAAADEDPYKVFRSPLLREGSTLVEARAQIRRTGPQNWWTLALDPQPAEGGPDLAVATGGTTPAPHELTILPCTRLTEMERIIESTPADQAANLHFEVSGRVYVFRDHNYLLPTHAAVISAPAEPPPPPTAPPTVEPATTTAPAASDTQPVPPPSPPPDDDSAEAIARALQQQAGPLARSSAQGATQRLATETPTAAVAPTPPNGAEAPSGNAQPASERMPALQENTSVVNRRGKITRDRSGGWLLVLDADASGLADPPLKLLPCMLLEDIEDYARRTGNNSPVVVTGQVYLYNGQNHLLPTVYRIPRETSRLTP